jgi:hypothetical protein
MNTDHLVWNHLLDAAACGDTGELVKECPCAKCGALLRAARARRSDWCPECDRHQDACTCAPVVTELSA